MKPKPEFYKKKKQLDKTTVINLLDHCSAIGVKSIQFNGQDEPTIYPDLIEIIKYASLKEFDDIYFNTNGSRLTDEMSKKLVDSGLTKIQISIDAFSQYIHKVRKKQNYNKIVSNVINLVKIRDKKSKLPLVRVSLLLMK